MTCIDLKQNSDIAELKSEICIIGSGPAGAVLAVQLAKQGRSVLVLESGGTSSNYDNDCLDLIDDGQKETHLRFGWSQQLGGASNLWAGRTCPFEGIDLEKRAWIQYSGWPFEMSTLAPYYEQATKLIEVPSAINQKQAAHSHLMEQICEKRSVIEAKAFCWAHKPFNAGTHLQNTIKKFTNLRVAMHAQALRIEEKENGSSIHCVHVKKPNGDILKVEANQFIIAAGGLETPRLLLNSNILKPHGVGNDYDCVGRYFSTHPKANIAALILNKPIPTTDALLAPLNLEEGAIRYGIGLSPHAQKKHKLLNHYVQCEPLFEHQANEAFERLKNSSFVTGGLVDRGKLIDGFLPGMGKMLFEAIGRVARLQPKTRKFILRGFLDQYPNPENRITLSRRKKSDGTLKANIHWNFSKNDRQSVIDFMGLLDKSLRDKKIGCVSYDKLQDIPEWPLISMHSHFMGSTRMGLDPKTSVTDKNGKVHNYTNLYITGPSLFPTYGYANPFLTIVAMSLRMANHLKI